MKRELITRKSAALDKDMSLIVYGEGGYPVIAFQAQDSKCNGFEDFGMVEALADYIEDGVIQLFSVDNNDEESWSATEADKAWRAGRQEAYFAYVTDELVPLVHELNGTDRRPLAIGCSMGATHAALAALRRPDLFQGCIALSGVYDARYFFGDWMDETLYNNSVVSFLPNMPADHPYVALYGQRQIVMCVGQGAWEEQGIADLRVIADAVHEKGIDAWCDFWGYDVNHDWPWWKKQARYFLPIVLEDMDKTLAEERQAGAKPAAKARRTARKAASAAQATTKKAAAAAAKAAGGTKAAAKKAAGDVRQAEKAASAKAAATTKRAKTAARKAEDNVEAAAEKVAAGTKAAAKRTASRAKSAAGKTAAAAKKAGDEARSTATKASAAAKRTTAKAASAATATAKKAEADVEKVAAEAEVLAERAKTTTRRAATRTKVAAAKAADEAKEAAEKAATEVKAAAKKTTSRRAGAKKAAE